MCPDNTSNATSDAMIASWDWCVTNQNKDPENPIMVISTSYGGDRFFDSATADANSPAMTTSS